MIKELKALTGLSQYTVTGEVVYENYFAPNSNITQFGYINTALDEAQPINIIIVPPVKNGLNTSFGDPLKIIKDNFVFQNKIKSNIIFVYPVYTTVPWYANHPTNITIQQEKDTLEFINFIKNRYSNFTSSIVSILGFSKSGWGALSLAMRANSPINYLFIWDAPLGISNLEFGLEMEGVFVNDAYFDTYDLKTRLPSESVNLTSKPIYIGGYNLFQTHSTALTNLFSSYPNITYSLDETLNYSHLWLPTWMEIMMKKVNFIFN